MSELEHPGSTASLRTPLYDLHIELGAKMVPFAGYDMPVQFPAGIMQEHRHTRDSAGLFDVSHMGQFVLRGASAALTIERLLPIDAEALSIGQQTYTQFTNADGGIDDDLIVCRWSEDSFFLVVNAACKQQDFAHVQQHTPSDCELVELASHALLALQGPKAADVLATLAPEVSELFFMQGCWAKIGQHDCFVTRSGYTGEDGFEISIANEAADSLARRLLAHDSVEAIGLGARDSLRLEAGLCLYGHDLNASTSPVAAGLIWSISKSRRLGGEKEGGFPGADIILPQIAQGTEQKRVGLSVIGRAPVREGATIFTADDQACGHITSGGFGPSVNQPVAMGYVDAEYKTVGTELFAEVRNKRIPVQVAALPFSPHRYHRP
ncbi:MAG: glycine cleavage system aminomethyltransferase GcvT [Pseudomonadales bacterium]